jgi:hypothetical protein
MSADDRSTGRVPAEAPPPKYRVGLFLTGLVILSIVVTLPFSLKSVVDDLFGPATGRVVKLTRGRPDTARPNHTKLHLAFVSIDESGLTVNIRVAGHHRCEQCDWSDRVLFVAITDDDIDADGMPPSASVTLLQNNAELSQVIQLPVRGHPIRYPFDTYNIVIGVVLQRLRGSVVQTLNAADASGHLFLSVQELLPRQVMIGPTLLDPASLRAPDDPFEYLEAFELRFERPRYVRVLAVLLVLLIAAAAAYSVFLRPLHDLVLNSGALVLGVWGIHGILTPQNLYYLTAVDLALSVVIIFLLGAITVRAFLYIRDQGGLGWFGGRR